jgi:two-component system NtrC family sensor kinase
MDSTDISPQIKSDRYQNIIGQLNRTTMTVFGLLALITPSLFLLYHFFFGKPLGWRYGPSLESQTVVVWDKLVIIAVGVALLLLSRAAFGRRRGRLLTASFFIVVSVAMVLDDLAGGSLSFTPAYLSILMFVAVAAPFAAWQTLTLCLVIIAAALITVEFGTSLIGHPAVAVDFNRWILLGLSTVLATGLSAVLHHTRRRQFLERIRAEKMVEKATESELKYRSLFDNSGDAIVAVDNRTGEFRMVNGMTVTLLGIPADQLIGMRYIDVIAPDDRERVTGYHMARVRGEPAPMQYTLRVQSRLWKEPRVCDLKVYLMSDPEVTVSAIRDITDEVEAQEKIRRYANELEATNRELVETQTRLVQSAKLASLGSLAAGVAHEINSPLGAIGSGAQTAERAVNKLRECLRDLADSLPPELKSRIEKCIETLGHLNNVTHESTRRIDTIVSSLRRFASLDEAMEKSVDIHEGIESTLTILPHPPDKQIEIVRNYGPVRPFTCRPGQLNQAFMNILMNAVEAILERGKITITTSEEDGHVVVEICDTGKGISKDHLERVFDPGFTTKGRGVGTGLGLPTAYRIIEDHHGHIEVSSDGGNGTTVRVRLPAA